MPPTAKGTHTEDTADARLPLSALLSQTLVAFTIECDNEFERQMPHRTTNHSVGSTSPSGPWLVSIVMWWNCMRFVGEEGISAGELEKRARTATNLNGMERWRYVTVEPDPADKRPKPPRAAWLIRPTPQGRKAQAMWQPLSGTIGERWRERFGVSEMGQLHESLAALVGQIDMRLPDCLPILGYGLFSRAPDAKPRLEGEREAGSDANLPFPALLSRALLAFALEFERKSDVSLAISADVIRVLDEKGVAVRDIPVLAGVSKEAVSMAMGILQKMRLAGIGPGPPGSRARIARLTAKGRESREEYHRLVVAIEEGWRGRFGKDTVQQLREALERLAGKSTGISPLFQGLQPYPGGWRASVRTPETLPHYPMVLHRGGFPDGS